MMKMDQENKSTSKVTANVIMLLLVAMLVANVGFIVTVGKATLELVYVLRDYVKALTEALGNGQMADPHGDEGDISDAGRIPPRDLGWMSIGTGRA